MITKPSTLSAMWVDMPAISRAETDEEPDAGDRGAATMDAADAGAAQRVDQLGVLGGERSLHLLEKPLLLL